MSKLHNLLASNLHKSKLTKKQTDIKFTQKQTDFAQLSLTHVKLHFDPEHSCGTWTATAMRASGGGVYYKPMQNLRFWNSSFYDGEDGVMDPLHRRVESKQTGQLHNCEEK